MRTIRALLLSTAAVAFLAAPAAAQDGASVGARRKHALVISWANASTLGYALRVGERVDLVLEAALALTDEDDLTDRTIALRPSLKRYVGPQDAPVAPYLVAGLVGSWTHGDLAGGGSASSRSIGGFAGIGLDWFPHERVSLGGDVGLQATATSRDVPGFGGPSTEVTGFDLRTFASTVRLKLYF